MYSLPMAWPAGWILLLWNAIAAVIGSPVPTPEEPLFESTRLLFVGTFKGTYLCMRPQWTMWAPSVIVLWRVAKQSWIFQGFINESGCPCNGRLMHVFLLMDVTSSSPFSADDKPSHIAVERAVLLAADTRVWPLSGDVFGVEGSEVGEKTQRRLECGAEVNGEHRENISLPKATSRSLAMHSCLSFSDELFISFPPPPPPNSPPTKSHACRTALLPQTSQESSSPGAAQLAYAFIEPNDTRGPRWCRGQTTHLPPKRTGLDSQRDRSRDFRMRELCLFSRGSPTPLAFRRYSILTSLRPRGSQDLDFESRPDLSTQNHSFDSRMNVSGSCGGRFGSALNCEILIPGMGDLKEGWRSGGMRGQCRQSSDILFAVGRSYFLASPRETYGCDAGGVPFCLPWAQISPVSRVRSTRRGSGPRKPRAEPPKMKQDEKRGSYKGDTVTRIKGAIAAKRTALNCRAVISLHWRSYHSVNSTQFPGSFLLYISSQPQTNATCVNPTRNLSMHRNNPCKLYGLRDNWLRIFRANRLCLYKLSYFTEIAQHTSELLIVTTRHRDRFVSQTSAHIQYAMRRLGCCGVVVRLLASHPCEPGSIPGGVAPLGFLMRESCRTMSLVAGFSRGSSISTPPPPLHSDAVPCSPRFTFAGSRNLDIKGTV
ncbi:hypothetical protein PR048_032364 [Dryococelus australis]|uniref:Uncharacterized protein n=1 Tax=Dryococelus australis TaxID=614101 RepID=A0ABQ9G669_9NEOP|nr:hypothetical protein PR048_032364 [Dryococelus australis]